MDIVVGLIFWGGLLLLTLNWLSRSLSAGYHTNAPARPDTRVVPHSGGVPQPPAGISGVADPAEQELREDEALADGLVIGHFLTRDHYRDRIAHLEGQIDELTGDRDRWLEAAGTGDDLYDALDYAEFDALGGFGVEPWADDLFDVEDED